MAGRWSSSPGASFKLLAAIVSLNVEEVRRERPVLRRVAGRPL